MTLHHSSSTSDTGTFLPAMVSTTDMGLALGAALIVALLWEAFKGFLKKRHDEASPAAKVTRKRSGKKVVFIYESRDEDEEQTTTVVRPSQSKVISQATEKGESTERKELQPTADQHGKG